MKTSSPLPLIELISSSGLRAYDIHGNAGVMVSGVGVHAQKTARNEMFVALAGTSIDSHMMLGEAVEAGASVLLVERETMPYPGVTTVRVPSTRAALGHIAHAFYGHPSRGMKVCGITGTNGKTTSTHIVASILRTAGMKTGIIGTLGAFFGGKSIDLNATTPSPLELAQVFHAMQAEHVDAVVMECSSHAIDQYRLNGLPIRVGGFIGLTQDHLDYHGTMENYAATKRRLFTEYVATTPGSVSCFNLDDTYGAEWARDYAADWKGYSRNESIGAHVTCSDVQLGPNGTTMTLTIEGRSIALTSRLIGAFNVTNMLAAATCAHGFGIDLATIAKGISECEPVAGRFEVVNEGQPFSVIVDYAHTPDALERVLRTARRLCAGRIITVFGCGGDRDRTKRPPMGRIVGECTDFAIVTSDNPRTEDPAQIARQVVEGVRQSHLRMNRCHVQLDRREAIDQAIAMAGPGDLVLIAGKGHEPYQEIQGRRYPFDDREVARQSLRRILPHFQQMPVIDSTLEITK